jgi:hypothetical protein
MGRRHEALNEERAMIVNKQADTMRDLNPEELESISGGAQYPTGWPDGPFGSR